MDKHVPARMCVCCRERKEKSELIKVVKTEKGFVVSNDDKIFGRGAYVCKNAKCIELAIKKRAFDRSFKQKLPDEIYALLKEISVNS